jgi:threonine dehydratase
MQMHIGDVFQAQKTIQEIAKETPCFRASSLDAQLGINLYLKAENLQKTGSFKVRGAANFLLKRCAQTPAPAGVVAASSGNHGQAVAFVAQTLGIPAVIVMPEQATRAKVNAAVGYGAQVEFCGTTSSERLARAKEIALEKDYLEVPPYDHEDIMAGQGTLGVEIIQQVKDADAVFVPIGGGGLVAGVAFAVKTLRPDIQIIGVEPAGSNSMYVSRLSGSRTALPKTASIADGLLTLIPGELTFPMVLKYVDEIVLVQEAEIGQAMRLCLERFKLLPEPSGAVSFAAALKKGSAYGKNVVAIVSGGNADLSRIGEYLAMQP